MPFQYKRILILGATSGIGRALGSRFIKEGSFVIATGRRQSHLDSFVSEHGSDSCAAFPFDLSNLSSIPAFVEKITKTYPDLDLVFVNAGIQRGHRFNEPESIDLDVIQSEMSLNYTAPVAFTKAILPFLIANATPEKPRALLYTTSCLAIVPLVRAPNYSASKAGLHAIVLCLRAQLQDSSPGVKVLELLPPAVQTELHDAKNQPDIKDGRNFGMPLDVFTNQAYESIAAGNETSIIGGEHMGGMIEFESKREEAFWKFAEKTKGGA